MPAKKIELSQFLSYILHPLLIPTLATSVLLMRPDLYTIIIPDALKIWYLSVVIIFTLVIPVAGVLILLKFNAIQSVELKQRGERTFPLLIACSSFVALLYLLTGTNIPAVFLYVIYSAAFALLAGLFINMAYKISLHTLGWGALVATLIGIALRIGYPLPGLIIASVLLSGIVGYARLKQNTHNEAQVYAGYVVGAGIITFISYLL
jgi:hypothetical protein